MEKKEKLAKKIIFAINDSDLIDQLPSDIVGDIKEIAKYTYKVIYRLK